MLCVCDEKCEEINVMGMWNEEEWMRMINCLVVL